MTRSEWIQQRENLERRLRMTLPGSSEEKEIRRQLQRLEKERVEDTGRDYIEQIGGDVYTGPVYIHQASDQQTEQTALQTAYLKRLFAICGQVSLTGIDRKVAGQNAETRLNLNAVYTALLTLNSEHLELSQQGQQESERSERRLSALAQLNQHKHLVLLGEPGSGKSSFVNFVIMCLAGEMLQDSAANLELLTRPIPKELYPQPWEHGTLLPVLVRLREFAAKGLPSENQPATGRDLWEFIHQNLREDGLEDYALYLQQHLREYGGLLLLDGLDEVPEASQRRVQIKQAVEQFRDLFPRCRILVTSRTYAYQQQEWRLQGFQETVLAPFCKAQIDFFVDHWYIHVAEMRAMDREDAQGRAELLKRSILHSERLQDFARRPLLLTLMASLHAWRGGSLPEKREELYNDVVDLLLDWWESPKILRAHDGQIVAAQESLSEMLNVEKETIRKALELIAFRAHAQQSKQEGTVDIAESDLIVGLMTMSHNKDLRPARLIEYLSQRAGLLLPRGVGVYSFPHRSFQEYLAACYLTEQSDYPDNIAELARQEPSRWREVLLLASAKASRGTARIIWVLAEELCYQELDEDETTAQDAWGALLAGQALAESARLHSISPRNRPKVNRVQKWLVAILEGQQPFDSAQGRATPFPAVERTLAGNVLAILGEPRPGVGLREDDLPDIEWCEVPSGEFLMGSNEYNREKPERTVEISVFAMSRHPVTNSQYQAFVDDGGYTEKWRECWNPIGWKWKEHEMIDGPGRAGGDFDLSNHPVIGVSWYEASAFCQWFTLRLRETRELAAEQEIRLPREAEWEKAARGTDGRTYPWGNEKISSEYANYAETVQEITTSVGCFPRGQSVYGCEDMIGNVWEWCKNHYDENEHPINKVESQSDDTPELSRAFRGGSWNDQSEYCRASTRSHWKPESRLYNLGFRIVRTPS